MIMKENEFDAKLEALLNEPELHLGYMPGMLEEIDKLLEKNPGAQMLIGSKIGIMLMAMMVENTAKKKEMWEGIGEKFRGER